MVGDVEAGGEVLAAGVAVVLGLDLSRVQDGGDVAAIQLPRRLHAGQALLDVDGHGGVGVGARRVVHRHRRLIGGRVDGDLAEGDADVGEELARHIDLLTARAGAGGDAAVLGGDFLAGVGQGEVDLRLVRLFVGNVDIHCGGLLREEVRRRGRSAPYAGLRASKAVNSSLRRHDPDQVRRVRGETSISAARLRPPGERRDPSPFARRVKPRGVLGIGTC